MFRRKPAPEAASQRLCVGAILGAQRQRGFEAARDLVVHDAREARALLRHQRGARLARARTLEGLLPRQRTIERRGEGEDVAASVHRVSARLLRRHVAWRAEDLATLGVLDRRRDAEVEQPGVAPGVEHDVARRDVAMHQPAATVRVGEGVRQLRAHVGGQRRRERPRAQHLGQRRALDVLHRQEVDAVDQAQIVDRDDVRMTQADHGRGLAHEELHEARVARQLREDLLHHQLLLEAGESAQPCAEDARHPSARDLLVQEVVAEGRGRPPRLLRTLQDARS